MLTVVILVAFVVPALLIDTAALLTVITALLTLVIFVAFEVPALLTVVILVAFVTPALLTETSADESETSVPLLIVAA